MTTGQQKPAPNLPMPETVSFGWNFVEKLRIKAGMFGVSGSGKSRLASIFPDEWGNGILIDYDGHALKSTPKEERKRFIVISPSGRIVWKRGKDGELARDEEGNPEIIDQDYKGEANDLSRRNWPEWLERKLTSGEITSEQVHGITPESLRFKVMDTMTHLSTHLLRESGLKQWFSDKNPVAGAKHKDLEVGDKWVQPQMGDYRMAQQLCLEVIEKFTSDLDSADDLHAIVTFQEGVTQDSEDGTVSKSLLFGPMLEGRKGPRICPPRFDATFWLTRTVDSKSKVPNGVRVQIQPSDNRVCGFKGPDPLAVPFEKMVGPALEDSKKFWQWVLATKLGA